MKLKYFEIAEKLSRKSEHNYKIGAVIVFKNKIVGLGYNIDRTHTKSTALSQKIHAELSAILNTRKDNLEGHELYLYRKDHNGFAKSRPCIWCQKLIKSVGIKKVYYSDINGYKMEEF